MWAGPWGGSYRVVIRDRGAPGLVMGPCIVEIDRIVIRDVQYQFEVNRCRNEEVYVKLVKISDPASPQPPLATISSYTSSTRTLKRTHMFQGSNRQTDRQTDRQFISIQ
ncbi:hypothetical protein DPMN_080493 [Dreissena polymorpha]|uniref:Uncharacterized protein n=1 Tax=Dreissena polymorpha TaxID=45954 RepID=A0A9D4BTW6_DREPO|nr:hypothetical protein DPMN_080493 [Dreissena polymorpha]